jgi:O-antigen ligase
MHDDMTNPPAPDRTVDVALASVAVFVLTRGPVFTLWSEWSPEWDQFAVGSAIVASFWLVYALVGIRLQLTWRLLLRHPGAIPLLLLGAWLSLSTLWSTGPAATFSNGVGTLGVVVVALWLRTALSLDRQLLAVFVGCGAGIALSALAVISNWLIAVDPNGETVGIYGNRNSLAPIAMLTLLAGAPLLITSLSTLAPRDGTVRALLRNLPTIATLSLALWLLVESRSMTSWFALAGALATGALVAATRGHLSSRALATGLGLLAVSIGVGFVAAGSYVSRLAGRGTDFTFRGTIWRVALDGVAERPVLGWGYLAAWWNPEFRDALAANPVQAATVYEAHNGFLEVLLGAGPLAVVLLGAALVTGGRALSDRVANERDRTLWWLVIAAYCLLANLVESFIGGHHIVWLLLASALLSSGSDTKSPPGGRWRDRARLGVSDAAEPA